MQENINNGVYIILAKKIIIIANGYTINFICIQLLIAVYSELVLAKWHFLTRKL